LGGSEVELFRRHNASFRLSLVKLANALAKVKT
jgi:hypothetical protein